MSPSVPAAALAAALVAAAAAAQVPVVGPQEPEPQDRPVLVETRYSEPRSLALFEACDRDADDRLDVFEIRDTVVDLQGTRDPAIFRKLDTDSSGFVEWYEFDARLRTALERAGSTRLRPYRTPPELSDPTATVSDIDPTEKLLGSFDTDGNGGLSQEEFAGFLRKTIRDDRLASQFEALDLDHSELLDVREFAPVLQFVPQVWEQMSASEDARRALPPEFRAADRDLNGAVDRSELRAALTVIHPSLARWSERILAAADRTRNGSLGAAELAAATAKAKDALSNPR